MIYAFLIHSAENVGAVHFSHFYTGEGNDQSKASRQQTIIRKVLEDKTFQQQSASYYPTRLDLRVLSSHTVNSLTTSKRITETYPIGNSEAKTIPVPTDGVVLIGQSGLFEECHAGVWKQLGDVMFTVVCSRTDNLTLFSNTLLLIIEHLCRIFGLNKLEKLVAEEPDQVELVITPHFRGGSPLIANYSVHRSMVKADESDRPFMS